MAEAAVADGRLSVEDYLAEGARRGIVCTEQRCEVLFLLWNLAQPVGAYEAAARLSTAKSHVHATSVYRCFHRLQNAGLVIRVVSWNRYMLTPDPAVSIWGLLLCKGCETCIPIDLSREYAGLAGRVRAHGYAPSKYTVECGGRCRHCLAEEA